LHVRLQRGRFRRKTQKRNSPHAVRSRLVPPVRFGKNQWNDAKAGEFNARFARRPHDHRKTKGVANGCHHLQASSRTRHRTSQRTCELESTCPVRRERSGSAGAHADAHPSRLDRRDERLHAADVHDPREFVGEHVQGHPGGNLRHGSNSRRITPSGCSELIDETNLCISQRERDRQGP
jgi:hypothetical protein